MNPQDESKMAKPNITTMHYWVYILHCNNGAYYTGYTTDLPRRYQEHLDGKGSKYTRSFKPTSIAQSWKIVGDKSVAMKIENYIKKLSKKEKERLVLCPELLLQLCEALSD